MVTQLVGDPRLEKRIGHTGELAAMRVLGMWPKNWHHDTTYIARKLGGHHLTGKGGCVITEITFQQPVHQGTNTRETRFRTDDGWRIAIDDKDDVHPDARG